MEEMAIALVTAGMGFVAFVVGQFALKMIVEPITSFRKLLGDIDFALMYHAPKIASPFLLGEQTPIVPDPYIDASANIRELASRLKTSNRLIPLYNALSFLGIVPQKRQCGDAATNLIGISNGLCVPQEDMYLGIVEANQERLNAVHRLLKL